MQLFKDLNDLSQNVQKVLLMHCNRKVFLSFLLFPLCFNGNFMVVLVLTRHRRRKITKDHSRG